MRPFWRGLLVSGAVGVASLTAGGPSASAHWFSGRGGAFSATEFVSLAPTAYLLPTAYVLPTSYVATSYVATPYVLEPTAYVVPSVYATSYAVPSSLPTSYVFPTSRYYATTLAVPTIYESAYEVVPSAYAVGADPCVTTTTVLAPEVSYAPTSTPVVTSQTPTYSASPQAAPKQAPESVPSAVKPAPTLESIPDPDGSSDAPGRTEQRNTAPPSAAGARPAPLDSGVPSPPVAPVPDREPTPIESQPLGVTPIDPQVGGQPPVAPGGEPAPIELPKIEEEGVTREVRRPVLNATTRSGIESRYLRKATTLGVLEGKVLSSDSGTPEPGVKVTLTNRAGTFVDRVITTDPSGHYAVRLPDGDWTVKVTMPSGKVYAVSQLTVDRGQINDDLGRDIPTLNINR